MTMTMTSLPPPRLPFLRLVGPCPARRAARGRTAPGRGSPRIRARAGLARAAAFTRADQGAATIELGIGVFFLIALAVAFFAAYSRVEADTTTPRMAVTMADYVSREETPDGAELTALGQYLHENELRSPAPLVYVISAIRSSGSPATPTVCWVDTIRLGDPVVTEELAADCGSYGAEGENATLGSDFTVGEGETVFVVELCARPTGANVLGGWFGRDIRHHHALPTRHPDATLARPARVVDPGSTPPPAPAC